MEIKKLDLIESNEIMCATIQQYLEDRTFEMYVIDRLFNEKSYLGYKENLSNANKKIDADKIKNATNKALQAFKNSYGKEEE